MFGGLSVGDEGGGGIDPDYRGAAFSECAGDDALPAAHVEDLSPGQGWWEN